MSKGKNSPSPRSQQASILHREQTYIASGPIPPASILAEYRSIRPDLPDLIIDEWLKEAETRRTHETKRLELAEKDLEFQKQLARDVRIQENIRIAVGVLLYILAFVFAGWLVYACNEIPFAIVCATLPVIGTIACAALNAFRKQQ